MSIPVDKQEKKAAILSAALRVFARKGAVGTKVQDIATEAGIAKGTIYLYYKNKDAILQDIIHQQVANKSEIFLEIIHSDAAPGKKLKSFVSILIDSAIEGGYPLEIMPEIWAMIIRADETTILEERVAGLGMVLEKLLSDLYGEEAVNIDISNLAASIIAMYHGAVIMNTLNQDIYSMHKIAGSFIDAISRSA